MVHSHYMKMALEQARMAQQMDEVPVGALLVNGHGDVIATGYNETISQCDPSAHAEMLVLRRAAKELKNYRLLATTLYVTVEPCVMCMGAIIHARVTQVVFGTHDPKWGAAGSLYDFSMDHRFNHRVRIIGGICKEDCQSMMKLFFRNKRITSAGVEAKAIKR